MTMTDVMDDDDSVDMRQVIDESLRLYTPVPMDLRFVAKDDVLPSGHGMTSPPFSFVFRPLH